MNLGQFKDFFSGYIWFGKDHGRLNDLLSLFPQKINGHAFLIIPGVMLNYKRGPLMDPW